MLVGTAPGVVKSTHSRVKPAECESALPFLSWVKQGGIPQTIRVVPGLHQKEPLVDASHY